MTKIRKIINFLSFILFILVNLFFVFIYNVYAIDRCADFIPDVRSAHTRYFGSGFPYHYGIGVMINESGCKPNIVSFDGGIGLYQFTPSTGIVKEMKSEFPNFNPSNPEHSIKAFVFYEKKLIKNMNIKHIYFKNKYHVYPKEFIDQCGNRLCYIYMIYNGGLWLLKEWEASGRKSCEFDTIKDYCKRGGAQVGNRWLSFCDVNYSYSLKVYKFSKPYKRMPDGEYLFW